jgi:hypothetical protein
VIDRPWKNSFFVSWHIEKEFDDKLYARTDPRTAQSDTTIDLHFTIETRVMTAAKRTVLHIEFELSLR